MNADDAFWRRPPDSEPGTSLGGNPEAGRSGPTAAVPYTGAPRSAPPPHGWRPPTVVRPAPPRHLPEQDRAALDVEEQAASTLTKGIGLLVGAVMIVGMLILCGRAVF